MKITLREHTPARPLPRCPNDHKARYMIDGRRSESKGGHFIECRCSATARCPSFDLAWAHWHKMHGSHPMPSSLTSPVEVPQLQLRLVGGTDR